MNSKITICLLALLSVLVFGTKVYAVSTSDNNDPTYLYNCGYSKETIRILEDEKVRTQGGVIKPKSQIVRYVRGLFFEPDFTEHNQYFGRRKIRSK
ncbi:MAG: hypothetical protein WCK67_09170 [bacterium]